MKRIFDCEALPSRNRFKANHQESGVQSSSGYDPSTSITTNVMSDWAEATPFDGHITTFFLKSSAERFLKTRTKSISGEKYRYVGGSVAS